VIKVRVAGVRGKKVIADGFGGERKMALDKDKLTEKRIRGRKCRAQGVKGSGFYILYNELSLFST